MNELLNVDVLLKRLESRGVVNINNLKFLGKHTVSDMLPMSSFFMYQYTRLMKENRYCEFVDVLLDKYKADRDICIVWCILRFYEDCGINLAMYDDILSALIDNERTSDFIIVLLRNKKVQAI